jgi:hypothetical protein
MRNPLNIPILVAVVCCAFYVSLASASDSTVPNSFADAVKDQVALAAEKTKRADQAAKSSMSLMKLRIASKLTASEEALSKQVELLSRYEEELRDTPANGDPATSLRRNNLEILARQTRSAVTSQLDLLKHLLMKIQELREKIIAEEDADNTTSDTSTLTGEPGAKSDPTQVKPEPPVPFTPPGGS